jgi:DNA/RNA-binding domain of Phe-tRNA-synthetase-like protein
MGGAPVIAVSPDLRPVLRLGVIALDGVTVVEREARLDAPLSEAESRTRSDPPAERLAVRAMYRRIGLDPTKRRPSSEALLRRVRKGEPLPRINSLVDVCNWCSLEFQLPYGLYDLSHVSGGIVLRLGHDGESYPGIRKDDVHVGGRIALADDEGAFGNPSSDSARTMVTTATTRALLVVFAPSELDPPTVDRVVRTTSSRARDYCGGVETFAGVE